MSESNNVKLVKSVYAAFLRNDVPGILAHLDESIEFTVPGSPAVPMSGTRRGHEGMRQFFEGLAKSQEFSLFEPREYIAQGNKVVALVRYEGRNRRTGRSMAADSAMVWTLENGKITRFVEYTDTEAAANAAKEAVKSTGAA